MTGTIPISSKPGNKSCVGNIKLYGPGARDGANNSYTDSTHESELTFSMSNIALFNQVTDDLILALDRLENQKEKVSLKIIGGRK